AYEVFTSLEFRRVLFRSHLGRIVGRLVREVIQGHGLEPVGDLQPLRTITVVDLVPDGEVAGVHAAIRPLQVDDRLVEQTNDLLEIGRASCRQRWCTWWAD